MNLENNKRPGDPECVKQFDEEFEFQNNKAIQPCHFYDENGKYNFW